MLDVALSDPQIEKTADAVIHLQEEELKHSPLSAMEAEYEETKKKIQNINNAIAAGIWNTSTSAMLKELETAAEDLRISCETLRYSQTQLMDRDRVIFFLRQFSKGDRNDPHFRRHVIETFVNAVFVFDDHLKIVINNCEGNQTLRPPDLPDSSDNDKNGVLFVTHPNTKVTVYRIAV